MWIIKDDKKEEYDTEEVKIAKSDWGTYIVTIADNIRQSSVIIYETKDSEEASIVGNVILMKIKGKDVKMYKNKNKIEIVLARET